MIQPKDVSKRMRARWIAARLGKTQSDSEEEDPDVVRLQHPIYDDLKTLTNFIMTQKYWIPKRRPPRPQGPRGAAPRGPCGP